MEVSNGESSDSRAAPAAGDWYFKVIGEELGPFTFDEVVSFAEQGYLSADAEVKDGVSGIWSPVESVARLVAALPAEIPPPTNPSPSNPPPAVPGSAVVHETQFSAAPASRDVEESNVEPISPQLSVPVTDRAPAEDRKTSVEIVAADRSPSSTVDVPAAPAAKIAGDQDAELDLIEAQADQVIIQLATKRLIARTFGKNGDKVWWGWIGGTEYGPVDFAQLVEWVTSGRLRPTDFVRFGIHAQYTLVGNVPGLHHAANITSQTTELLLFAMSRVATAKGGREKSPTTPWAQASTQVNQPSIPVIQPSIPVSQPSTPTIAPQAAKILPASTITLPATVSPSDSKASVPPVGDESRSTISPLPQIASPRTPKEVSVPGLRPIVTVPMRSEKSRRAAEPSPSSLVSPLSLETVMERLKELFKDPRVALGAIAILVSVVLLLGWLQASSGISSADIGRYKELKKLMDDLKSSRAAKATDFSELKARAEKLQKAYVPILERKTFFKHPEKQALFWAVRDVLPRVMKENLKTETKYEKDFDRRLEEVKKLMKIHP